LLTAHELQRLVEDSTRHAGLGFAESPLRPPRRPAAPPVHIERPSVERRAPENVKLPDCPRCRSPACTVTDYAKGGKVEVVCSTCREPIALPPDHPWVTSLAESPAAR
jgi:hypothetical protein